ncbi:hypothetical protein D8B26_002601 [Coccidioides posadasii str. Silveira]|uniref:uncharacterized protein n=1 Tax=Coccidioides posadasii (strain RMSCC 757 / Silveira) TaxID=443226 RepID=UPI001BEFAA3B|nr:hypothetical protein D8B26_002601 [Coccidioides posadasii str. Silveira]
MTGARRTRSGRSISQEPTGQGHRTRKTPGPVDSGDSAAIPTASFGNPSLQALQAQHSFAYGATGSPALPRQLRMCPPTGAMEMAANIEGRYLETHANDFERIEEEARANPGTRRSTRSGANTGSARQSVSPVRRTPGQRARNREPTPDDQLLESLREASEEAEETKETILPSIEDSSVSWNTERHILGDPRSVPTATSSGGSLSQSQRQREAAHPMAGPPLRPYTRSQPRTTFQASQAVRSGSSAASSAQPAPRLGAAPVLSPPQAEDNAYATPNPRRQTRSVSQQTMSSTASQRQRGFSVISLGLMITIFMLAVAGMLFRFDDIEMIGKNILQNGIGKEFSLPSSFCGAQPPTSQYIEAFDKLSAGVDRRLADMARDVATLKDEWNRRLPHLKQAIWPEMEDPLLPRKINWFSVGMGAFVDPYLTTKHRSGLLHRGAERAAGMRKTNPPVAALTRWEEHGDCWCVNDHTSEIQLAVLLGRPLVPEEVVIEHIQKEATLDPESAPREMELWVEYVARSHAAAPSTTLPGFRATGAPGRSDQTATSSPVSTRRPELLESSAEARAAFAGPLSPSQHEDIISTLRMAYPDEPETAYSHDTMLGSSFYRIGKFQYDINGKHNIQKFHLDAVIDLPNIRTKKAVLRVKSNWGSVNTCVYRVRLHGHM